MTSVVQLSCRVLPWLSERAISGCDRRGHDRSRSSIRCVRCAQHTSSSPMTAKSDYALPDYLPGVLEGKFALTLRVEKFLRVSL